MDGLLIQVFVGLVVILAVIFGYRKIRGLLTSIIKMI